MRGQPCEVRVHSLRRAARRVAAASGIQVHTGRAASRFLERCRHAPCHAGTRPQPRKPPAGIPER
eukprot:246939-Lingulodinium_polyedra.AAC.1